MLSWLHRDTDVNVLIARKQYPRAIAILEQQLRRDPRSIHLRQLFADALARTEDRDRAVAVLEPLVDEFVAAGFVAKAIAVLKKIQRIDRRRPDIAARLAELAAKERKGSGEGQLEAMKKRLEAASAGTRRTAAPSNPAGGDAEPPFPTSEVTRDWFEEAMEKRREFHWSPLLAGLPEDELSALIGGLELLVKKPGAIIYGEDEPGDSMFILASGKARLYRRDGVGHYEQLAVLREGEFFGEASVLTGSNRLSTITAATECELLELDRATFERISESCPKMCETIRELYRGRATFETTSLS